MRRPHETLIILRSCYLPFIMDDCKSTECSKGWITPAQPSHGHRQKSFAMIPSQALGQGGFKMVPCKSPRSKPGLGCRDGSQLGRDLCFLGSSPCLTPCSALPGRHLSSSGTLSLLYSLEPHSMAAWVLSLPLAHTPLWSAHLLNVYSSPWSLLPGSLTGLCLDLSESVASSGTGFLNSLIP